MTKKNDSYGQAFLLFYGLVVGLLAGTWGGFWGTIAFEYIVRKDASLETSFWFATLILVVIIATLSILMIYFLKRGKNNLLS